MNDFKNEGGLQFRFRTITREQNEAEIKEATDESSDVVGLTAKQSDLHNRVVTGEPSKATASTSELLAETMRRVANDQSAKRPDVQVSERKVTVPQAEPEASYTQDAASVALSASIRKARGLA
jgi:hypothetical protein